jgi:hypothetical protein
MGFQTTQWIKNQGFNGFKTIAELRTSKLTSVPKSPGVYLILKNHIIKPEFLAKSPAGWFKGKDPSIDPVELRMRWISGESYAELFRFLNEQNAFFQARTQRRAIKMDHVMEFTDGALSFDAMLFVGAIADIAEGKGISEEIVERLRVLQTRLKLGLSNSLEIWLYTKGYVDREVCKLLASSLGAEGTPMENFEHTILRTYSQTIKNSLSPLPSYFMAQ